MKKHINLIIALLIISASSFGQTADDVICVFTKKENGKVFTKNEDGSRFVNFVISGIKSDQQAFVLKENVKKSAFISEFTISDEMKNNERKAYMSIKKGTKVDALSKLLMDNGINYIKLDDKISKVSELKSKAEKKQEKMKDPNKP
ncbi:MAG TPA: hypothetical protein PKI01_06635 [Bacteroidales bacterium]|nr:hypothetical protein [Bacteroidales bacterium]